MSLLRLDSAELAPAELREVLALPPGNLANQITTVQIPAGTRLFIGRVGPLELRRGLTLPGGGSQVFILDKSGLIFGPGDDSFGAKTTGTITARVPKSPPREFHDGYQIRFDNQIIIEGVAVRDVYVVPTGRYPFEPGKNKMDDLFRGAVMPL